MIIKPKHFAYLVNQHGKVASLKDNFEQWKWAYEKSLEAIFESFKGCIPNPVSSVLDIGSGLGGIDVLLNNFLAQNLRVYLLDGDNKNPEVEWSYQPHNCMTTAFDFLHANGVKNVTGIEPAQFGQCQEKFDLVVSFAAYGFHIHPGNYLEDLKKVIHDKTVLIFDVRKSKPEWLRLFIEAFGVPKTLERAEKYVRLAFRA